MIPRLAHVESWIFDLDNSLYPASTRPVRADRRPHGRVYPAAARLRPGRGAAGPEGLFPRARHHARRADARASASIRTNSSISSTTSISPASPPIRRWSRRSTGCRGASSSSPMATRAYARRVLDRLGLANAFDGMHDIHAMDYVPKPDPARLCGDVRAPRHRPRRAPCSPTTWRATSRRPRRSA